MAISEIITRAQLSYEDVKEHTGWPHIMIDDYLGIGEGEEISVAQIDANTAAISTNFNAIVANSADIIALQFQQDINTVDIQTNATSIQAVSLSVEDAHQLIGALVIQNGKLRSELLINQSTTNDNAQLASRV